MNSAENTPHARTAMPRAIWALGFVSLLMDTSSELIHSLLPVFMVTVLGASATTVGLIEGMAEATALIVKVFSGVISDWWGKRKPLTLLGYGLAALTKPLFALATSTGLVLTARLADRVGKGIRGAPRDALIADITPPEIRGAAFGLRQSLDTVGAIAGPLLAMGLMLLWHDNFRAVFWVAVIPAVACVLLLWLGVQEPERTTKHVPRNPITRANLRRLNAAYWGVVGIGAVLMLARFSEAFLLLRAQQGGLGVAFAPLVLIVMNLVYSLSSYPVGKLSDRMSRKQLLSTGLAVLIVADLALAHSAQGLWLWAGVALWGLHMGMTHGLLSALVADTAPADLRGTAYGMFNLVSGVALLVASVLAGELWDRMGAQQTFIAGAAFSAAALLLLLFRRTAATA